MPGFLYARLADAGTFKIDKNPNKITHLKELVFTGDATGKITFTDGTNTYVVDVAAGVWKFHRELSFAPDADVTLTCAGANISVFGDVYVS